MIYPIRSIVAGISEIDKPDPVLAAAITIAERTEATLHLVFAFDPTTFVVDSHSPVGGNLAVDLEEYREDIQLQIESQVRAMGPVRFPRLSVVIGIPEDEINSASRRENADLIIVGASRHGRISRVLLGTTAARVIREAPVPVLVIREPSAPTRKVLLATDLSELSEEIHEIALDVVESLNPGEDPEVRSVYVEWHGGETGFAEEEGAFQQAIDNQLSTFLDQRRPRRRKSQGTVRFGDPADEILAESADWKADLLVVGTHSKKAPARWLAGSVAKASIREARCNVLVIPVTMVESRDMPVIRRETPSIAAR
jgi:nucleotide-binding universal stress UspA family protein